MRYLTFIVVIFISTPLWSLPGKVILANGSVFKGDVQKCPDGGAWVYSSKQSVKFERPEISRVVIYSGNDTVRDRFIASYRMTPASGMKLPAPPTQYEGVIAREAMRNNLDPALVKAVIRTESNFDPFDRSRKGACGLMQIMPGTAKILGVRSIFSPDDNIRAGTRYLRDMLSIFGGDLELALAAYNAGPAAVKRYRTVPPYRETREYVRSVYRHYRSYSGSKKIFSYTDTAGRLTLYNEH